MTDPACKDCRFYQPHNEDPINPDGDSLRGECRFNPPTIIPSGIQSAEWPVVNHNHWCGKFEPKNAPKPDSLEAVIERNAERIRQAEGYTLLRRAGPESDLLSPTIRIRPVEEEEEPDRPRGYTFVHEDTYGKEGVVHLTQTKAADTPEGQVVNRITLQYTGPPAERDVWQEYVEHIKLGDKPTRWAYDEQVLSYNEAPWEEPEDPEPTAYGVPLSEYPDDLLGNDGLPTDEHAVEFLRRRYPRDVARRPELYTREEGDNAKRIKQTREDTEEPRTYVFPLRRREMPPEILPTSQKTERDEDKEVPAQTDWEADRIATHNSSRRTERVRLAKNADQRKMDESASDLGMGEDPEHPKSGHHGPMSDWPDHTLLDAKDPKNFSAGMEQREGSGNITVRIWGKQSSIRVEAFVDDDGKDVFQVFENGGSPYVLTSTGGPEWKQPEEPAQTDWEADRITTHNERYAERARHIGRLAHNARKKKKIVDQVGLSMATLNFPNGPGIPISRPGGKVLHVQGELWEFLSQPYNQLGIWLVDTEATFPPGPYQLRWADERWYSDDGLPKWPRA